MLRSLILHGLVPLLIAGGGGPHARPGFQQQYGSACPAPDGDASSLQRAAEALRKEKQLEPALHCFARAAGRAAEARQGPIEAQARLAFAQIAYERSHYDAARREVGRARELFDATGDRASSAFALRLSGSIALLQGQPAEARQHYEAALQIFTSLGMERERATVLTNLARSSTGLDAGPAAAYLEEAIALARRIGARDLEGTALHLRSDGHFSAGRFDSAIADLNEAIAALQQGDVKGRLGEAYVSLGRILRAHGRAAEAIPHYDRAAAIQEAIGDLRGLIQSINAKAVALAHLGRAAEARAAYERALELAKRTESPRLINFQRGNLATAYADSGDHRGAIRLLEDVLETEKDPYVLAYRHGAMAQSLMTVKELERASVHAERAIEFARTSGNLEFLPALLHRSAVVYREMGRTDAALKAAAEGVDTVEQIRARLVPLDFMKRGFSDTSQEIFGVMISLLQGGADHARALVVSEQARARAFLDLLASREIGRSPGSGRVPQAGQDDPSRLASIMTGSPATAGDIAATAARLESTILSYWVAEKEMFIWVARPSGEVQGVRVPIGRADLQKLVAESIPSPSKDGRTAFTRLHALLVQPVRAWLPPAGQALTIIPHGPLFRLSFAALRDARGRYLLERHPLSYAPSVSTLVLTAQRGRTMDTRGGYLLIADPSPRPSSAHPLPALPAARREAAAIARVVGAGRSSLLVGSSAGEPEVRRRLGSARVLHLATHGVIRDDEPFESFLALGAGGAGEAADGRLTVREIYGLTLSADLVVLSACRTATGPVSGDGIAGLSRALFYAGTPTVVATLWDVADEPSARLMAAFYRHWRGGTGKRAALRNAQLELLRDLRAGTLRVPVRGGFVPLQEQPFYWAGYIAVGEP